MKRKLAFLTAAIIGLSSVPIATLSTDTITYVSAAKSNIETFGDFEYTPYTTYAEINKYTGSDAIVELPSEINGLKVTRIADSALCNCKTLEKLIIPEGVTRIGKHALSQNNNLQEIQFPSTLESIGFAALGNNKSLIEIHLPEGLKIIDNDVFNTCYAIKDIYIPSSVESIGSIAPICYDLQNFHVDENNKNYCDVDGVLYSKDKTILVRYPENRSDETYIIPETVIEIANSAFETDRNIIEIDVPDTVIKIGERCFSMCSSLKSVRLPDGLTEIPDYCFGASEKIEKIYIPKSITNIGFTAFQYTGYSADKPFKICYEGTQNDWNNITIGKNNSDLEKAEFVYSYSFDSDESIKGDVNADGNFTVADVVMLQKWLLAVPDVTLSNWKAADLCEDGTLNVFDLCMMKRELVNTETESNRNIYSEKKIDMIGYSDELWEISNSDKASAIITSTEELRTYLSQITEKRVIDPMLDKYNDDFFNYNILLVRSIYQSCGGDNMYQIDSVQYEGDSLVVNYSDNYGYESYIAVVNGLLAQVVIPKKNYHADSVEWRFTSYFDTPMLFIDDYMIIESSNGWKDEAYERVITLNGSRYSRPLCDCAFFSTYDHMNHIKSEGTKEDYINDYDVLERISRFSKNAANYKDCKMKDFGFSVEDFGETKLSVLYKDENGNMQSLELYRFGEECACLDNEEVQDFIAMLIDKGYIPDKNTLKFITNDYAPQITMNDVFELSKKGEKLTWSDFKGYKHGKNIASVGSGRYAYEFKVADYSDRFKLQVAYSDENKIRSAHLICSTNFVDICKCSEEDIMLFIAKYNPPA